MDARIKKMRLLVPVIFFIILSTPCFASEFMAFVAVGDPGNAPDPLKCNDDTFNNGAVNYDYRIGECEVTCGQYAEFLNAVAASDPYYLYTTRMETEAIGGIIRSGNSGSYTYICKDDFASKPVCMVAWRSAARFINWMCNGRGSGSTEHGAYDTSTFGGEAPYYTDQTSHTPGAAYWIPSSDEWYKAAYYDPQKHGEGQPGYWFYATQHDNPPIAEGPPGGDNSANYYGPDGFAVGAPDFLTDVGAYDSTSYYGAYDMTGNLWEWTETWATDSKLGKTWTRACLGGAFHHQSDYYAPFASAYSRNAYNPPYGPFNNSKVGFRVAALPAPEPATLSMMIFGFTAFAAIMGRRVIKR
jgi:formylglycine-generating enzyme required for sulfatase activity